jgi:hypothetical protein
MGGVATEGLDFVCRFTSYRIEGYNGLVLPFHAQDRPERIMRGLLRNVTRRWWLAAIGGSLLTAVAGLVPLGQSLYAAEDGLDIHIEKKGLGKEVTIRQGTREWFMMVEVTPENTVIVRQEKNNEAYVLDESENHDRALTSGEVDTAITDFVNSVKAQTKKK